MNDDTRCGVLDGQPRECDTTDVGTPLFDQIKLELASAGQEALDDQEPVWPTEADAEQAASRARQQQALSPTDLPVIAPPTLEGQAIVELCRSLKQRSQGRNSASDAEIVAVLKAWLRSIGLGDYLP